ncbi:unnamed protein product, partial [Brenthis ino]
MRLLCYFLVLPLVVAQVVFGNWNLGDDQQCHKWSCLSTKLNINALSITELTNKLQKLLPDDWKSLVTSAVIQCYVVPKDFMDTCPGQGFLHCFVSQLNKNCPEHHLRDDILCGPQGPRTTDSANSTFMFKEVRIMGNENVKIGYRPVIVSFKRCCELPQMFNNTILSECGFEGMVDYKLTPISIPLIPYFIHTTTKKTSTTTNFGDQLNVEGEGIDNDDDYLDPLECCNLDEFIQPTWRSECDFKVKWDNKNRLTIVNESEPVTTTTTIAPSLRNKDVKIVPISCDQQNCIFTKLNIVSDGTVDKVAFVRLLDNMTKKYTQWERAKAKVVTQCLNKPLIGYEEDCEINKILACTFDILTENCPDTNDNDPCKHSTSVAEGLICQISSSMYRPRHRRQFCSLPDLINKEICSECGVNLIYKLVYVTVPQVKSSKWTPVTNCKDLTEQTTCLFHRMNVLNKYGFVDHFKMHDRIKSYTENYPPNLQRLNEDALNSDVLYPHHCSSTKKLLSVIDTMIMTCIPSRQNNNEKCQRLMNIMQVPTDTSSHLQIDPNMILRTPLNKPKTSVKDSVKPLQKQRNKPFVSEYKNNPLYNFGILGKNYEPSVEIIDLKKEKERTLVLLPVYERLKKSPNSI